ncbi:MAG: bifunctional diaminohydroxyphosphoribosylaminopyrimidine deaminase/5-amino-6-(5-phosphoribosylamino)uracil reductase RibD [Chloroflexi bacterium]|nr:bifunctional diaminohydroxyphosphoribosylaminopyrimidine deaminase/5-amino-6-(5-phosphoribosylamino)uracil reductase RibD [Chloroflexota bacterium]
MARALELARAVKGRTSPNPAVGAVVIRDGRIAGEGATQPYGRPHAEVIALRAAGPLAAGATLYVTLEPCSHYGRTPPCVDAVIEAGIAEVHLATLDPNPEVCGRGLARLEAAGIRTVVGEGRAAAQELNEEFARWVTTGRPLVIAKFAASLDGRIATWGGDSRWITGPEARAEVHRLRDRVDAIVVGVNTVIADNPELTTRMERPDGSEVHHPRRFVLDSTARTPPTARVLSNELPGRTTIVTTELAPPERRAALEAAGAEVWTVAPRWGHVALDALLDEMGRHKITSLLVEGGAAVHGAFFDDDLVDRVMAFIAPLVIGGRDAPSAVGGTGARRLADSRHLSDVQVERLGADTLIAGYTRRVKWPREE